MSSKSIGTEVAQYSAKEPLRNDLTRQSYGTFPLDAPPSYNAASQNSIAYNQNEQQHMSKQEVAVDSKHVPHKADDLELLLAGAQGLTAPDLIDRALHEQ